jgi:hypothetical protein
LDCDCGDHGRGLDCSVEILNCHPRIGEVEQAKENEMMNSSVSFVGETSDGDDRVMESGLLMDYKT